VKKPASRQLVIATHSADFVRGIIDSKQSTVKVIRISREGDINHAYELNAEKIRKLWADPILRFSNVS